MKRIISFAVIALISCSLSAGTLKVNLDPALAGGSPNMAVVPDLSGTVGDTGTVGIWATPDAIILGLGLDVVASDAIKVNAVTWNDFKYFGGGLDSWDVPVPGAADGNSWLNTGRGAVGTAGLDTTKTGFGPPVEWDPVTGSFLVATVDYELVALGDISLQLAVGPKEIVESTGYGEVLFGQQSTVAVAGNAIGATSDGPTAMGAAVPEPSTAILALLGLFGLVPFARKRK